MNLRSLAIATLCVVSVGSISAACSNTDDGPENNRIGPIDGPATVNDDVGADQDGADQDGADQDGAGQDGADQDGAGQDGADQDGAPLVVPSGGGLVASGS